MTTDETPAISTNETHAAAAETTRTPDVPSVDTTQGEGRPPRGLGREALLILAAAAITLGVMIYAGIRARLAAEADLTRATAQAAIPTVDVVYPKAGAPAQEIVLPGTTQAFIDAPIYARTNGYLKRWYFGVLFWGRCPTRPARRPGGASRATGHDRRSPPSAHRADNVNMTVVRQHGCRGAPGGPASRRAAADGSSVPRGWVPIVSLLSQLVLARAARPYMMF
jgi:hypothetical protein